MVRNRDLASQIASNYAANAQSAEEIVKLLNESYDALRRMDDTTPVPGVDGGEEEKTENEGGGRQPLVDPQKAIGKDAINCLVCGKAFKTLKRHLNNAHGMTPEEYRTAFGLSKDYPLVAANLSEQRAKVAKDRGLGERLAEARKQQRKAKAAE